MSGLQPYKVSYRNKSKEKVDVFFVDRAFVSAYKQAKEFIERNKHKYIMQLYYRDTHGKYKCEWERVCIL